jgi:uncharacterized protein YcbK (DUF882 family)
MGCDFKHTSPFKTVPVSVIIFVLIASRKQTMSMHSAENTIQRPFIRGIDRRGFLKIGMFATISGLIPAQALSAVEDIISVKRSISFYNLHTKEELQTTYFRNGQYIPEAMSQINHIMRDHYCGAVKPIDKKLIDLLHEIQLELNSKEPFHLISVYRTVRTNVMLSKRKKGVAMKSLHTRGKAADIRIPGYRLKDLRRAAYTLKRGGVGYYPKSNFVHVDVGKIRYW